MTAVGKLVKKKRRDRYIQKEKQYTKQYKNTDYTNLKTKIQNKQTNIQKKTFKKHKPNNQQITKRSK